MDEAIEMKKGGGRITSRGEYKPTLNPVACRWVGIVIYIVSQERVLLPGGGFCFSGMDFASQEWSTFPGIFSASQERVLLPGNGFCFSGMDFASRKGFLFPRNGFCFPGIGSASRESFLLPRKGLCFPVKVPAPVAFYYPPGVKFYPPEVCLWVFQG